MLEYLLHVSDDTINPEQTTPHANASAPLNKAEDVSYRLGAIELALETMIRLGVDKNLFTEEQFLKLAQEIDAEDGIIDGRRDLNRMKKICGNCGKPNGGGKNRCMWCGADLTDTKPVPNEL